MVASSSARIAVQGLFGALAAAAFAAALAMHASAGEENTPEQPLVEKADEPRRDEVYIGGDEEVIGDLQRAAKLEQEQKWSDAAAIYQAVIEKQLDDGVSALVVSTRDPLRGDIYISAAEESSRRLARFPAEALAACAAGQEKAAKAAFERAEAARDVLALKDVSRRYAATGYAARALGALGDVDFERGNLSAAADAWARLLARVPAAGSAALKTKLACCRALLGDGAGAREMLRGLPPGSAVTLAGRLRTAEQAMAEVDALAAAIPAPPQPPAGWPSIAGNAACTRMADETIVPGSLLWSAHPETAAVAEDVLDDYSRSRVPFPRIHYPVAVEGCIYVNTGVEVACYGMDGGRKRWSYEPAPRRRAARDLVGGGTVDGDRFIAAIGGSIAALDRATGALLWRTSKQTDPVFGEDVLISQPAVAGGKVIAGVTTLKAEGESFVVALDIARGTLIRKVFIESHARPRHIGLGALGAIPAVAGGKAVYCTNLGTVAAIDVDSLEVDWLWRYTSCPPDMRDMRIDEDHRWSVNPPAIVGGKVIVAPQDSTWLCALDLGSGELLWRQPARDARYFIAPETGRAAFLFGRRVWAVEIGTGKLLWASPAMDDDPAGRPVAGKDALLVCTRSAAYRFDPAGGKLLGKTAWDEPLGGGNLCVAGGRLIVGTPLGVRVYKPPGTPANDWRGLMELGRFHLRNGQTAEAVKCLKQSLDLSAREPNEDEEPGEEIARDNEIRPSLMAAYEKLAAEPGARFTDAALENYNLALAMAEFSHDKARLLIRIAALEADAGQYEKAVAGYQEVLGEYRDAKCDVAAGLSVLAGVCAQNRLEELIARQGVKVYAAAELKAGEALAGAAGMTAEYEKIMATYPNSQAAVKAAAQAAKSTADAGQPDAAADAMRHAADVLPERNRPELLRAAAQVLSGAGRPDLARAFLAELAAEHPGAMVGPEAAAATEYCRKELERPEYAQLDARAGRRLQPPLDERWRAAARLSSAAPLIVESDLDFTVGTPFGPRKPCFIVHSDSPRWMRMLPGHRGRYDYLECRAAREGYLVWSRALRRWDGDLYFTKSNVVVARPDSMLALDAATGATAWKHDTGGGDQDFTGIVAAAADRERVYFCTAGGQITCLSAADGSQLWQQQIEGAFLLRGGIVILEDYVAVFSENPAGMHGFDKQAGTRLHSLPLDFPNKRINGRPILVHRRDLRADLIAVPVSDTIVSVIEGKTAKELWHRDAGFVTSELLADPSGEHLVIVPDWGVNARLQVVDSTSGNTLWEHAAPRDTLFDTAVDDRGVYTLETVAREQRVKGFSLAKGEPLFEDHMVQDNDLTTLVTYGDCIIVSGEQARPRAAVLNRKGEEIFSVTPGGVEYLGAGAADGTLVVATDRGTWGYGRVDTLAVQLAAERVAASEKPDDLERLAQAFCAAADLNAAAATLAKAMQIAPDDGDYLRIYDRMSGIRDRIHERNVPTLRCVKMDRPPVIDGLIADDWDESASLKLEGPEFVETLLPGPSLDRNMVVGMARREPNRWRGINDLSMKVYAGWDKDNLYIAVDLSDRTHRVMNREVDKWAGDLLILGIDCLNDGGYGYGFGDFILTQGLMDKPKDDKDKEDSPEGNYSVKVKEDHSGVVYESAMPWKYLKQIKPALGTRFGMGITVTDDDGGGVAKCMSWTPGIYLHKDPSLLSRSFAPELLGDVELTLPRGYTTPGEDEDKECD